jgi:hypothetical protein
VRRGFILAAIISLAAPSAQAATESAESDAQCAGERRPAETLIADLANANGMRTLVYSEHSDGPPDGQSVIGIGVIAQPPASTLLVMLNDEQTGEILQAIACEEGTGATDRWRVSFVADNGVVTVERGVSPGPIDGFNARLRAAANRTFPGHTAYPHEEAAE